MQLVWATPGFVFVQVDGQPHARLVEAVGAVVLGGGGCTSQGPPPAGWTQNCDGQFLRAHCRSLVGSDARAQDRNQIQDKSRRNVLVPTFESSKSGTSGFEEKSQAIWMARLSWKLKATPLQCPLPLPDGKVPVACLLDAVACICQTGFFDVRQPRA